MVLSACTSPSLAVSRGDAQSLSQVQDATVLSVRPVTAEGTQAGLGSVAGGVIGGIAGASVGGRRESVIVGVLGAVAGAVAGSALERTATRANALEIVLHLPIAIAAPLSGPRAPKSLPG